MEIKIVPNIEKDPEFQNLWRRLVARKDVKDLADNNSVVCIGGLPKGTVSGKPSVLFIIDTLDEGYALVQLPLEVITDVAAAFKQEFIHEG